MSDTPGTTGNVLRCDYCGGYHTYSAEMCKDLNKSAQRIDYNNQILHVLKDIYQLLILRIKP